MIRTIMIAEDNIVTIDWMPEEGTEIRYRVLLADSFSGKQATARWTPQQLAAVMFLAHNNDVQTSDLIGEWSDIVHTMYEIAEPLFKDLPAEVRCIP